MLRLNVLTARCDKCQITNENSLLKGALSAKIVNFCYPQKLSDMIDALIKRVSLTYKCYEMYVHRG